MPDPTPSLARRALCALLVAPHALAGLALFAAELGTLWSPSLWTVPVWWMSTIGLVFMGAHGLGCVGVTLLPSGLAKGVAGLLAVLVGLWFGWGAVQAFNLASSSSGFLPAAVLMPLVLLVSVRFASLALATLIMVSCGLGSRWVTLALGLCVPVVVMFWVGLRIYCAFAMYGTVWAWDLPTVGMAVYVLMWLPAPVGFAIRVWPVKALEP